MKVDFEEVFRDRLDQVKKDIRRANKKRDWETKRSLVKEKKNLEAKLKNYEPKE